MILTGNLIGPQTFRPNQAPEYTSGFAAMLICYCVCIGLMSVYWMFAALMNARREADSSSGRSYGSDSSSLADSLFADLTDFQQKGFRYTT